MADRKTPVLVPNVPDGNGDVRPTGVIMPDGRCLPVTEYYGCEKGASRKLGIAGKYYMVKLWHSLGDERRHKLWRDGDSWFVWEIVEDDVC